MEDGSGVFLAAVVAVVVGLFSGLISYDAGRSGMRDQAVAAGVGCYVAPQDGSSTKFQWNCKPAPAR